MSERWSLVWREFNRREILSFIQLQELHDRLDIELRRGQKLVHKVSLNPDISISATGHDLPAYSSFMIEVCHSIPIRLLIRVQLSELARSSSTSLCLLKTNHNQSMAIKNPRRLKMRSSAPWDCVEPMLHWGASDLTCPRSANEHCEKKGSCRILVSNSNY